MATSRLPFADSILRVAGKTRCSYHSMPLFQGASLRGSRLKSHYRALLCDRLSTELTVSSPFVDCLMSPERELAEAECAAADDFGADRTFFVTCGTTISNEIALRALSQGKGIRVLADRMLHQSMHFGLQGIGARVDYIPSVTVSRRLGLSCIDLEGLKAKLSDAEAEGAPYDLMIVNGQSYEGLAIDVSALVRAVLETGAGLRQMLSDEAWGAAAAFHPRLRARTAMAAANEAIANENGFCIVATQSAHKSLSCLRQASLIHVKGCADVARRIGEWRYRCHTTSPSNTILASLDLACAQAREEGHTMLERSIRLAETLAAELGAAGDGAMFGTIDIDTKIACLPHVARDPTKLLIASTNPRIDGKILRKRLFEDHGIYVSRTLANTVLLNFHIGIQQTEVDALREALRRIEAAYRDDRGLRGVVSKGFIVAYPPGVPLALPGDVIDDHILSTMRAAELDGSHIVTVG